MIMLTSAPPLRTKLRIRPKHVLFIVLGLMTLFVLHHDETFFFHHESTTWKFFHPVRWKIFLHGIGGATALTLGAVQFSSRLRQHYPALHRLFGRFYVGGVLVAAPVAVYLAFTHALAIMATETTMQASMWVLTTSMAICAARNKNFEVHKQWMMRSYAITLIFVVSRIILALPIAPTTDEGAERIAWTLITCALIVPQLIINWQQLFRRHTVRGGREL
jgi:hypothetical protein